MKRFYYSYPYRFHSYDYYCKIVFERASTPSDFKMLVASPSPRDIHAFLESVDECLSDYDKIWYKYFPQVANPYTLIRRYFMRHRDRYTHLAILPDDLVLNKKGVNRLVSSVIENPEKYQVLMGTCNVDLAKNKNKLAFTHNLPSLDNEKRRYDWYTKREAYGKGIIQVPHCGTPFAILSREVVERVSLGNIGGAEDVVLSWDLHNLGIPIYVDTGVRFLHLKER